MHFQAYVKDWNNNVDIILKDQKMNSVLQRLQNINNSFRSLKNLLVSFLVLYFISFLICYLDLKVSEKTKVQKPTV